LFNSANPLVCGDVRIGLKLDLAALPWLPAFILMGNISHVIINLGNLNQLEAISNETQVALFVK
jgi:hypothetical protein